MIKQSGPKVSKEKGAKEYRGLSCLTLRKVHFVLLLKRGQTNCNKCYVLDTFRKQIEKLIQGVPKRNKKDILFLFVSWKCFEIIINILTGNECTS